MKIKECAYFMNVDLHNNPSETCNLFPVDTILSKKFVNCEQIPISRCPYKEYCIGNIDKQELNRKIKRLLK